MIEHIADYDDLVYGRVQAEEFEDSRVCEATALLGLPRNVSSVKKVLDTIEGLGRAADRHDMTWDRLPKGALRDEVFAAAERYGYGETLRRDVGA